MEIQLAIAATKRLNPTGTKIIGYDIKHGQYTLLSRGAKDKQATILDSIQKYAELQGDIEFVLYVEDKEGNEKEITTHYKWNGSEAVAK